VNAARTGSAAAAWAAVRPGAGPGLAVLAILALGASLLVPRGISISPTPFHRIRASSPAALSDLRHVLRDRRGDLWLAGERGLYVLPADHRHPGWFAEGLPPGPVDALAEDAEGRIWAGASGGLYRREGARFVLDRPLRGRVLRLAFAGTRLWGASSEIGLFVLESGTPGAPILRPGGLPPEPRVDDLATGGGGVAWVLGSAGLLQVLHPGHQRVEAEEPGACQARRLDFDRDEHLWTAGSRDLCRVVMGRGRRLRLQPVLALPPGRGEVEALAHGPGASVWVAREGDVLVLDGEHEPLALEPALGWPAVAVRALLATGDAETLYFATEDGLFAWPRAAARPASGAEGQPALAALAELRASAARQTELREVAGPVALGLAALGGLSLALLLLARGRGAAGALAGAPLALLVALAWEAPLGAWLSPDGLRESLATLGLACLLGYAPWGWAQGALLARRASGWGRAVTLGAFGIFGALGALPWVALGWRALAAGEIAPAAALALLLVACAAAAVAGWGALIEELLPRAAGQTSPPWSVALRRLLLAPGDAPEPPLDEGQAATLRAAGVLRERRAAKSSGRRTGSSWELDRGRARALVGLYDELWPAQTPGSAALAGPSWGALSVWGLGATAASLGLGASRGSLGVVLLGAALGLGLIFVGRELRDAAARSARQRAVERVPAALRTWAPQGLSPAALELAAGLDAGSGPDALGPLVAAGALRRAADGGWIAGGEEGAQNPPGPTG